MAVIQGKGVSAKKKSQKTAKTVRKTVPAKTPKPTTRAKPAAKPKQAGELFTPTADQRNLVILGMGANMTQRQICGLIINPETERPISEPTLVKHFAEELETGKAKVLAKVAGNLVTIASDRRHKNSVTAAIFYLKTQAQWREPEPVTAELRRLQAEVQASVGDKEIEVTLVLEDRPQHITPPPIEEIPEEYR